MEELLTFFGMHGLWVGLIALVGIILLGTLKYCQVFKGIENATYRKLTYLLCSVGFSLIGCIIYMLCKGQLNADTWATIFPLAGAIWALNQTFYNIFKTTKFNDLIINVADWIIEFIKAKFVKEEKTEE